MSKRKKKRALLIERDALKRQLADSEEYCELLKERVIALAREYDTAKRRLSQQKRECMQQRRKIRRWQLYAAAAWLTMLLLAIAMAA